MTLRAFVEKSAEAGLLRETTERLMALMVGANTNANTKRNLRSQRRAKDPAGRTGSVCRPSLIRAALCSRR
ncbi:hypothetical protein [Falsigemmobacter faecalis]|uniref:Uncharacterized protein n=1 Tax=Falsigemmobacter faecalis TaxID=2488730 RepID=A0A3P3DQT8_9RHOB|nr:hypothetical protein [Falsigemmobacter faecalis]RRH76589.1 hypothetical protein EG244_05300 [Falsigemmobacter faecalis]